MKLITDSNAKNDKSDARKLARLALADVGLLKPVNLRDETHQQMLRLHEERQLLRDCRNSMICQVRCFAKSSGFRLPDCSTEWFHEIDRTQWPKDFEKTVWPTMKAIKELNRADAPIDAPPSFCYHSKRSRGRKPLNRPQCIWLRVASSV